MAANLSTFPIPSRQLDEILYDFLDPSVKPTFCIMFYTETVDEEDYDLVRVLCLKCCGIMKNPHFMEDGSQRPFLKTTKYAKFFNTARIKSEVKRQTYFVWTDHRNILTRGHYDFTQLSKRKQYIVANVIFEENHVPEYFHDCVSGSCRLE